MKKIVLTQNQIALIDDKDVEPKEDCSPVRFEDEVAKMLERVKLKVGNIVSVSGPGRRYRKRIQDRQKQ